MILRAYGDSWTAGEGCDRKIEDTLTKEEKILFQKEHSWVKSLSIKLNVEYINNGVSGYSNLKIFNDIIGDLKNGIINKNDLVIIMWSSSLRDTVPFLPNGEWVSWSVKHLIEEPHKFLNSYKSEDINFDNFFTDFKQLYITEIFNQNYYNIVNQNYVIFIQKMFEFYGVRYIMCDSFESMLIDLHKKDDITHIIDKTHYWGFNKQTFRDFLNENKKTDIWEYQDEKYKSRASQHPNKEGYEIIANELYKFIKKI
jgi:hypothetical protein